MDMKCARGLNILTNFIEYIDICFDQIFKPDLSSWERQWKDLLCCEQKGFCNEQSQMCGVMSGKKMSAQSLQCVCKPKHHPEAKVGGGESYESQHR